VRLQKVLAGAGVASRRAAEQLIAAGRVTVDGVVVTELGVKVDPARAAVAVDGRPVELQEERVYVLVHKPRGTIATAADPEGRERVADLVRERLPRVWPVGRLDLQTSGAILLTNDGELTAALTHPSRHVERVYHAKLRAELSEAAREKLEAGVVLEDGQLAEATPATLLGGDAHAWWYRIVLHEGRYHEVRRMLAAVGAQVQKLHRMEFAGLTVDDLRPAHYRFLVAEELPALYERAGLRWNPGTPLWRPPAPPRDAPKKGGRPPKSASKAVVKAAAKRARAAAAEGAAPKAPAQPAPQRPGATPATGRPRRRPAP
jgi:pseudouridine synthase